MRSDRRGGALLPVSGRDKHCGGHGSAKRGVLVGGSGGVSGWIDVNGKCPLKQARKLVNGQHDRLRKPQQCGNTPSHKYKQFDRIFYGNERRGKQSARYGN